MAENIIIRSYQPGDEENVVKLLNSGFDGWPHFDLTCSTLDHWKWKYQDNPLDAYFMAVGLSDDKIIGINHAIPIRIKIGDLIFLCAYAGDTVVDEKYRGRGIYDNLVEYKNELLKLEDIKFVYMVTMNPILIKKYLYTRFPFPHRILNLVRIRDIDLQLHKMPVKNSWAVKLGYTSIKLFNELRNALISSNYKEHDLNILKIDRFDQRMDEFWERVSKRYEFIVERSRKYLNWRYCDPRGGEFDIRQAEDGDGHILGYCVLRINRYIQDYPIGYIVDLLTLSDRPEIADSLVSDAVCYFDDENVNIVNYLIVRGYPYEGIFMRHGFLNSRIKVQLFYNDLGMGNELVKLKEGSPNKAYFSYGDIDSLPTRIPLSTR